ncbi:hypothetical protein [Streptomyces sp. NPDC089799]|uniref:hypothetical protein n=1 Tax=Streptomyces sp. NPDC089799 TaxID=3155066 RepID=UPI0034492969
MEALIAAVIGVCGTLCATWLTQRSGERALAAERRSAERLRQLEESTRSEERVLDLRRANYIALNQAARRYFGALNDGLHRMPSGQATQDLDAQGAELDEVRIQYRACYAEAQMVVPDAVLAVASLVNRELNQAYGILKRLHDRTPREQDSPQRIRAHLEAARGLLHDLRHEMRLDLGITHLARPERQSTPSD